MAKNNGNSRVTVIGSILPMINSRNCALADTATPAANAPNKAWIPSHSVSKALPSASSNKPSNHAPSRPGAIT
ncbi:hypothetical protein D3C81_1825230 [compost metagenome]